MMEFMRKNKTILLAGGVFLAVACVMVFAFVGGEADPPRIAINTTEEADFYSEAASNPHTAEGGIAVVGVPAPMSEAPADIIMRTRTVSTTDNPDTIWQDAGTAHTHGGFTIATPAMDGESIGILTIPNLGIAARVYEGEDDMAMMEKGVARFRHTSAWEGNIGLSAHNINLNGTPGYFLNIHTLEVGDIIRYETYLGLREYAVERVFSVDQYDWSALSRTQENRITLVTCITGYPELRLVVTAVEIP